MFYCPSSHLAEDGRGGDRDWTGCRAPSLCGESWLAFGRGAKPSRDPPTERSVHSPSLVDPETHTPEPGMLPTHGRNVSLQNDSTLVKHSMTCGSITINCILCHGFVPNGYEGQKSGNSFQLK